MFDAMARAGAYGNIQPTEFLDMDVDDAMELARRVTLIRKDEVEYEMNAKTEMLKVLIKAIVGRPGL